MTVLAICRDLFFSTRIRDAGEKSGAAVRTASTLSEALAAASGCDLVLLDLSGEVDVKELMTGLKAQSPLPRVIAFGSHTDLAAQEAAHAAGCDRFYARSRFVEILPELLAGRQSAS